MASTPPRGPDWIYEIAARHGLDVILIEDLTTLTLIQSVNPDPLPAGDVVTVTQTVDEIVSKIVCDGTAGARTLIQSFALPQQPVQAAAVVAYVTASSKGPYFRLWGNTPTTTGSPDANNNNFRWGFASLIKLIGGIPTTLSTLHKIANSMRSVVYGNRADNIVMSGINAEGRTASGVAELTYPVDAALDQLTHFGFELSAVLPNTTARIILQAPIWIAVKT